MCVSCLLQPISREADAARLSGLSEGNGGAFRERANMEFRKIRKRKNEIGIEAAKELLIHARRGVLAVNGDGGYPYAIPINFLYDEESNRIIFHGSKKGHKVDALKKSDKVCFTVYGNGTIKDESWAPYLESAVVFGRCHLVDSLEDNIRYVRQFALKYYPSAELMEEEIQASGRAVQMFVIDIEHMSGKKIQER